MIAGTGVDTLYLESSVNSTISGGDGIDLFVSEQIFDWRRATISEAEDGSIILNLAENLQNVALSGFEQFQLIDPRGFGETLTFGRDALLEIPDNPANLTGTMGNDVLVGTQFSYEIRAGDGNDWIKPGVGNIDIYGGAGVDMVSFVGLGSVNMENEAVAHSGGDIYTFREGEIENITGTSSGDILRGNRDDNWLRGLGGRDTIYGSEGADLINGGSGRDVFVLEEEFNFSPSDDVVSLLRGRVWGGDSLGTRLVKIEDLNGGMGNDILTGNHNRNVLLGSTGDDILTGLGGDDVLKGGTGTDTAKFTGTLDEYDIVQNANGLVEVTYTGAGAGDGYDRLLNMEVLSFADGDFVL